MEQVEMWHPDVPQTRETPVVWPRQSYEAAWKQRGWQVGPPGEPLNLEQEEEEE